MSLKFLRLENVCWQTSEVHDLFTSLRLTQFGQLKLGALCKLTHNPQSAPPKSQVQVFQIQIQASLSANALMALLSHIEPLHSIAFLGDCKVLDMSSYSPPLSQVSHYVIVIIYYILIIINNSHHNLT